MMMRIATYTVLGIAVLAVAAGLWFYRPWSEFSPAKINDLRDPAKFVDTFQNLDRVFPSRPITAGQTPRALPREGGALPETYEFGGEVRSVAEYIDASRTMGLMVIKDGHVLFEDYFQGASADSRFTSWSVAKSMVATLIFMGVKEGKIASLDDKAEIYAPQYAGTDFGNTSLRALLRMSSGIQFDENYADPNSDIQDYFFGTFLLGQNSDTLLFDYARSRPEQSDFQYISPNSHVLASVLRGVYGKPLADIVTAKLWSVAGMTGGAYWAQNSDGGSGMALGYCCMNARLADYARFGLFWLEAVQGRGPGPALLPDGIAELVMQPASPDHAPGRTRYGGRGYSHHFWLPSTGEGVFFANGVYGQRVWIDTVHNLVIARNAADPGFTARGPETEAFFRRLSQHFGQ